VVERTCGVEGCTDPVKGLGWCGAHYQRWSQYGDPKGAPPPLSLPGESWLAVPGYESIYKVSNLGRVQVLPIRGRQSKILRPHRRPDGHFKIQLTIDGRRRKFYVHKLVMMAFVGPCPEGMEVRHLNGDPGDNSLLNLVYGTKSENAVDRLLHGRDRNGRKTHCPRGHEYTPENTYVYNKGVRGHRQCRACRKQRMQERTEALRKAA
jgi:hypothetical protein